MNLGLLPRCEKTFALTAQMAEEVRQELVPHCTEDFFSRAENGGAYTVESLYYDTPELDFFQDGERDAPIGYQLRLRNYPSGASVKLKVEVKRRVRGQVMKSSAGLSAATWRRYLADGWLGESLRPAARQALETFASLSWTRAATPQVRVRYERQAWTAGPVRICLDRGLRCQGAAEAVGGWAPVGGAECVLEIKHSETLPAWLAAVVRRLNPVALHRSKYNRALEKQLEFYRAGVFYVERIYSYWGIELGKTTERI